MKEMTKKPLRPAGFVGILGLCALLSLSTLAGAASAADRSTGDQIRALLSGNTLQGSNLSAAYAEYYAPDGTLHGKGYSGKWKVEGDMGCMDYGSGFQCWTGFIDGNANIWYKDGKVDAAGMMVPGNPNNF